MNGKISITMRYQWSDHLGKHGTMDQKDHASGEMIHNSTKDQPQAT